MKKISLFVFLLAVMSLRNASANPFLNPDEFVMTHVTPHFPKQGVMIPGVIRPNDGSLPEPNSIPNPRVTLHWYPFQPHQDYDKAGNKYLIIERGANVLSRIAFGEARDFTMIGPHLLSEQSIILAPLEELETLQKENPNFRGKLEGYDPQNESLEKATTRVFTSYNLNPRNIQYNNSKSIRKMISSEDPLLPVLAFRLKHKLIQGQLMNTNKPGTYCFIRRPLLEEQEIYVVGEPTNAKQFYSKAGILWRSHVDTIFQQMESATALLFDPVFQRSNFPKFIEESNFFVKRSVFMRRATNFNTFLNFVSGNFSFKGEYSEDSQLCEGFRKTWVRNMTIWDALASKQTSRSSPYFGKPFNQTPYGNSEILAQEIQELQVMLETFDPLPYLSDASLSRKDEGESQAQETALSKAEKEDGK